MDTVLFDKTGTLTEGRPKLIGVAGNRGVSENSVLALAAAVERGNDHPLGLSIVWEAVGRKLEITLAEQVEAIPGKGVRGIVDGRKVVVGRLGFLQESGVFRDLMLSEAMTHRKQGHGIVFVGEGDRNVGVIVMNDQVRVGTHKAVDLLKSAGLHLVLLTGDHAETGQGVASAVGIDEVIADTLPAEKYAVVQKLKGEGKIVAMCGDGINDAPALVAADVGIAMGTGTRAAIGTAGVTLAQPDLRGIGTAHRSQPRHRSNDSSEPRAGLHAQRPGDSYRGRRACSVGRRPAQLGLGRRGHEFQFAPRDRELAAAGISVHRRQDAIHPKNKGQAHARRGLACEQLSTQSVIETR